MGGKRESQPAFLFSPRMVDVVTESGDEQGELVQRPEQRVDPRGADDGESRVGHAHRVRQVVERIGLVLLLDPSSEAP